MKNRFNAFQGMQMLDKDEQIRFYLYTIFQLILNFVDIISIGLLGIFISIGLTGQNSVSHSESKSVVFDFLPKWASERLTFQVIGILAILSMVAKSLAANALIKLSYRNLEKCAARTADDLLEKIGTRPDKFLGAFSTEDISFALKTGIDAIITVGLSSASIIVTECFLVGAIFIFLVIFQNLIAMLILFFGIFLLFILKTLVFESQKHIGQTEYNAILKSTMGISEFLALLPVLKVQRITKPFLDRISISRHIAVRTFTQRLYLQQLPKYIFEISLVLFGGLIYFVTNLIYSNSQQVLLTVSVFALSALRIAPSLLRIHSSYSAIQTWTPLGKGLLDISAIANARSASEFANISYGPTNGINVYKAKITVDNDVAVLDDITFDIQGNGLWAIIGQSGAGKTSLLKGMLGLIPIAGGKIQLNISNPKNHLKDFGPKVGYVPQITSCFGGELYSNIALGVTTELVNRDRVDKLVEALSLNDVAYSLNQFNSDSTDSVPNLSAGELQRLGIARALYHEPEILFLDEPLSNLDPEMENHVLGTLRDYAQTHLVLYITHRQDLIGAEENILHIDNGRLVYFGKKQSFN